MQHSRANNRGELYYVQGTVGDKSDSELCESRTRPPVHNRRLPRCLLCKSDFYLLMPESTPEEREIVQARVPPREREIAEARVP